MKYEWFSLWMECLHSQNVSLWIHPPSSQYNVNYKRIIKNLEYCQSVEKRVIKARFLKCINENKKRENKIKKFRKWCKIRVFPEKVTAVLRKGYRSSPKRLPQFSEKGYRSLPKKQLQFPKKLLQSTEKQLHLGTGRPVTAVPRKVAALSRSLSVTAVPRKVTAVEPKPVSYHSSPKSNCSWIKTG